MDVLNMVHYALASITSGCPCEGKFHRWVNDGWPPQRSKAFPRPVSKQKQMLNKQIQSNSKSSQPKLNHQKQNVQAHFYQRARREKNSLNTSTPTCVSVSIVHRLYVYLYVLVCLYLAMSVCYEGVALQKPDAALQILHLTQYFFFLQSSAIQSSSLYSVMSLTAVTSHATSK